MYDSRLGLSTVTSPVVSDFRRGGLKGFLERSLSPEVMLTRSSLDIPPAEKAVHSWAPTQEPLAVSTWRLPTALPQAVVEGALCRRAACPVAWCSWGGPPRSPA